MTTLNKNQRLRLIPYKAGSVSAKQLTDKLGGKRVKLAGSTFRNRETDFTINWGNSNPPDNVDLRYVLNHPDAIKDASNKLKFFQDCRAAGLDEIIPQFWTDRNEIPDEAFPIVCRTILNGHSGRGIVIADTRDQLVDAPLYVQYIKKADEYRIHIGAPFDPDVNEQSIIIAMQQKRRRRDFENPNWKVRNHANGFIYARENVAPPECVLNVVRRAFEQGCRLDFGAVDVIYNAKQGRAYVLEINTAPGLEGQTLDDYANYFPNKGNQ